MKNTIVILLVSFVLFSCGVSTVDLAIDNPTNDAILVSIDELTVEVPPREVVWVEMGRGNHTITFNEDSVVSFNFVLPVYMLNPTLTQYLKTEQFYGNSNAYQSYSMMDKARSKTVNFLGIELEGNYEVISKLINPITWDCGPREKFPDVVEIDEDESYATLSKIWDPYEFIEEVSRGGN